jgi:hypothetical protein
MHLLGQQVLSRQQQHRARHKLCQEVGIHLQHSIAARHRNNIGRDWHQKRAGYKTKALRSLPQHIYVLPRWMLRPLTTCCQILAPACPSVNCPAAGEHPRHTLHPTQRHHQLPMYIPSFTTTQPAKQRKHTDTYATRHMQHAYANV